MKQSRIAVLTASMALALAFAGQPSYAQAAPATCTAPPAVTAPAPNWSGGEPSAAMQYHYHSIWQYIRDNYYDPSRLKDWDKLEHAYDDKLATLEDVNIAVKEMVAQVGDKWTYYLTPADGAAMMRQQAQGIVTSGLKLMKNSSGNYQIDVIDYHSPAYGKAFRERDTVRCINGVEIATLPKASVDEMLSGKTGDTVSVTAISAGDGSQYTVDVILEKTPPAAVEAHLLAGNIVSIRMPSFDGEQYLGQFVTEFGRVYDEAGGKINGIVLDLRNNQGGALPDAVKFISLFVSDGNAIAVKSVVKDASGFTTTDMKVIPLASLTVARAPVRAELVSTLQNAPLVILVNGSSASAAEVTLGGLKDNDRGTVIGVRTFGKGVGFKATRGPVGGTVSVTGMYYLTPDGHDVHGKGIDPHIMVEQPRNGSADAQMDKALEILKAQAKP